MDFNNDEQRLPNKGSETSAGAQKRPKISYARDFLLSLSELETCKKLPSGFDQSILSEFEDSFTGIQDRQKVAGSLPLQGFRRSEYGSSPPTRGESSNYSRGVYGKWESRSSGRSDRDSDSQSDRDSDSGRRYGSQSRRWQSPEHDGLLGSGSFPRPSSYAAGMSAPKVRGSDPYQLNRSNEPYHPPRPYKAVPHSRRESNDTFNDETFGSNECTSQDKVEEERRRRASFELMRKEQQKSLQQKQKLNLEKHKGDQPDVSLLLEDSNKANGDLERDDEADASSTVLFPSNDPGRSSVIPQSATSRPLVPPGFTNSIQEKNSSARAFPHTHNAEVVKADIEENILQAKASLIPTVSLEKQLSADVCLNDYQKSEDNMVHAPFLNKDDLIADLCLGLDYSTNAAGLENHLQQTSDHLKAPESVDDPEIIQLNAKGSSTVGGSRKNSSSSILEKIFESALTMKVADTACPVEHHDSQPEDTWSPSNFRSSKFAHWFLEEERKPTDESSTGRPNDLLALIVGGDKGRVQALDEKSAGSLSPEVSCQSVEFPNKVSSNLNCMKIGVSDKQEAVPTVLTCEDLEQTILSEYSDMQPSLKAQSVTGPESEQKVPHLNDIASQHLLSLLKKGQDLKDMMQKPLPDINPPDVCHQDPALNNSRKKDSEKVNSSGKTLTLETLFGTAFMKELQSVEAPVSAQRGTVSSTQTDVFERHGLHFPVMDDSVAASLVDEIGPKRVSQENVVASDQRQHKRLDKSENWLLFGGPSNEGNSSKRQPQTISTQGGDRAFEYQLPEEESLINVGNPLNPQASRPIPVGISSKGEFLTASAPVDFVGKLAAISAGIKGERPMEGPEGPFRHTPHNQTVPEIPYGNLHALHSSRFHPSSASHARQVFHPLEPRPPHVNSQLKFANLESMMNLDIPVSHQFQANLVRAPFHHPNAGVSGFDLPVHQPALQQMQLSNNYTPHVLNDFPRATLVPPNHGNQTAGFMQEMNQMQGFPFGPQQPNIGGPGMPIADPAINGGSSHPVALQRLIEMELSASSKQMHPFAVGHKQGPYGHELDMSLHHR